MRADLENYPIHPGYPIHPVLRYIQRCHKTIWQPIQQKYSELEGDLFYPPMIRVFQFDGSCFYVIIERLSLWFFIMNSGQNYDKLLLEFV